MSLRVGAAGLAIGLAAVLMSPQAAEAVPPNTIQGSDTGAEFLTDCGSFELWDEYVLNWQGKELFDSAGNLVRVVEHVWGSDRFFNSVTGASVSGTINSGETVNLVDGNFSQSGSTARITVPGLGVVFFDVGRFVIDFDEGLQFLAGRHHAWFEEDYTALCELLG